MTARLRGALATGTAFLVSRKVAGDRAVFLVTCRHVVEDAADGNLLSIARRELTASPLSINFEGRPVFLVDAVIVPGSSGGPVYYVKQSGNPHEYELLGVVSDTPRWKPPEWIPRPHDKERPLIHLSAVYHAHTTKPSMLPCRTSSRPDFHFELQLWRDGYGDRLIVRKERGNRGAPIAGSIRTKGAADGAA